MNWNISGWKWYCCKAMVLTAH